MFTVTPRPARCSATPARVVGLDSCGAYFRRLYRVVAVGWVGDDLGARTDCSAGAALAPISEVLPRSDRPLASSSSSAITRHFDRVCFTAGTWSARIIVIDPQLTIRENRIVRLRGAVSLVCSFNFSSPVWSIVPESNGCDLYVLSMGFSPMTYVRVAEMMEPSRKTIPLSPASRFESFIQLPPLKKPREASGQSRLSGSRLHFLNLSRFYFSCFSTPCDHGEGPLPAVPPRETLSMIELAIFGKIFHG